MEWIEGLDVVNVGLGAVLYDVNTHKYYTPNTDTTGDPNDGVNGVEDEPAEGEMEQPLMPDQNALDQMLIGHELAEAYDASGNSAERSET